MSDIRYDKTKKELENLLDPHEELEEELFTGVSSISNLAAIPVTRASKETHAKGMEERAKQRLLSEIIKLKESNTSLKERVFSLEERLSLMECDLLLLKQKANI